jgi:hypothetical protein
MAAARGRARRPKKARRVGGARVRRRAFALLARLVAEHQIPESHGAGHARAVHRHVSRALRGEKVPANKRLGLQLGAVLHDADDPKYFSGAPGLLPNARAILGAALRGYPGAPRVRRLALEAISHVSASANGNSAPPRAAEFPQLLYPRWADRLEQLGEGGVFRTHLYSEERGRPLAVAATPAPATAAEARAAATPQRFEDYVARKGGSASTVDHFYDKLLHLAAPLVAAGHPYFSPRAAAGDAPILEACLAARPGALEERIHLAGLRRGGRAPSPLSRRNLNPGPPPHRSHFGSRPPAVSSGFAMSALSPRDPLVPFFERARPDICERLFNLSCRFGETVWWQAAAVAGIPSPHHLPPAGRPDGRAGWQPLRQLADHFCPAEGAWSAGFGEKVAEGGELAGLLAELERRERAEGDHPFHYAAQILRIPKKEPCTLRRFLQVGYDLGQLTGSGGLWDVGPEFIAAYVANGFDVPRLYIEDFAPFKAHEEGLERILTAGECGLRHLRRPPKVPRSLHLPAVEAPAEAPQGRSSSEDLPGEAVAAVS